MALPQYDVDAICDHLSEHENCSIAVTWHNATAAVAPAHVTNTSIGVNVRIAPGFAVLGVRIRRPGPVALIALYTAINVCVTSLIPVPIATTLVPVATLCWGFVGGILVNVLSTCIGAYLGLVLTRHACRPRLLRLLGRHRGRWEALDASLAKHGWTIPLLIRCNTASPIVLTNVLLALTSLPSRTYLWTTFVGEVFTSFPFAYATYVGVHLSDLRHDPLVLATSVLSLGVSLAIAWKVGVIAREMLSARAGFETIEPASAAYDGASTSETETEPTLDVVVEHTRCVTPRTSPRGRGSSSRQSSE